MIKFILKEQEMAKMINSEPLTIFCESLSLNFNLASKALKDVKYCISQENHINKLNLLN